MSLNNSKMSPISFEIEEVSGTLFSSNLLF